MVEPTREMVVGIHKDQAINLGSNIDQVVQHQMEKCL